MLSNSSMSSGDSAGGRTVVLQALHGLPEDAIGEGLEGPEARPLVLAGECELEQPTCERPRGPRCAQGIRTARRASWRSSRPRAAPTALGMRVAPRAAWSPRVEGGWE
jgi:hypothetical protein